MTTGRNKLFHTFRGCFDKGIVSKSQCQHQIYTKRNHGTNDGEKRMDRYLRDMHIKKASVILVSNEQFGIILLRNI